MSITRVKINEYLADMGESALLADGFDEALIGFSQRISEPMLAVYDYTKMLNVLIERDGLDYEEAAEYLDFNVLGAWVGEQTPVIVMPLDFIMVKPSDFTEDAEGSTPDEQP